MFNAFQRVPSVAFGLLVAIALLTIHVITPPAAQAEATAGQLVISEFRLRGPNGANDEFIEIYNNTLTNHVVSAASGTGYGIVASDGVTRCSIPNGTRLNRGRSYLCVNSVGYSLASYPSGNGTTATGDATYTIDIPDNAGIALFNNNSGGASYSLANRIDAVGSAAEANTLYKEGTGYPALTPFSIEYSFVRDTCGKQGSITTFGPCPSGGFPVDTDDNATNFFFVATNGMSAGAGQRLGAPGPQNLNSPVIFPGAFRDFLVASNVSAASPPNRVRDFTSNPANNSTFGTLEIRRRFTNSTGLILNELRFRIIDLTTLPAPPGIADLRALSSASIEVSGITDPATCAAADPPQLPLPPCSVTIRGTILEEPPSQSSGGAFNATFKFPGFVGFNSFFVRFVLGVQQPGSFKFYITGEALGTIPQP